MFETLDLADAERATGELFSGLWLPYDDELFEESVALFTDRVDRIGFDRSFFVGKACLDAGSGGGRNTIAMARLGAAIAHGVDIGADGIRDARRRAIGLANARFTEASIECLPFADASFDVVWCAGVLMHAGNEDAALDEMTRVLKPGGLLYLLVYATGGVRWPLIQLLRPIAAELGQPAVQAAIDRSGLAANRRRTFLDDLFVPKFDFFRWDRLAGMLARRGYGQIRRWGPEARLDHEHSLAAYREDLERLRSIMAAGRAGAAGRRRSLFRVAEALVNNILAAIRWFEGEVAAGRMEMTVAMDRVIGQGHHRVFATKGA